MKKGLLKVAFFGMLMGGIFTLTSCHESSSSSMPETEPTEITVTAPTTYSIMGQVVNAVDGTTPAGTTVTLKNAAGQVVKTTTPASNGTYTFTGLEQGTYIVEATNAGYETTSVEVTVGQGANIQVAYLTLVAKIAEQTINVTSATTTTDEPTTTSSVAIANDATDGTTAEAATVGVNISAPAGLLSAEQQQTYGSGNEIVVTPFYNESEATTRAYGNYGNTDALYYGVWIHFSNGRNAPADFALAQPITITFDVADASVADYIGVYYWDANGNKQVVSNNNDMSYTISGKTVTLNTKKLFHFGLFFRMNDVAASASTENLTITRNKTVEGPTSDPIVGFYYKAGASMTNQSSSAATVAQKSFLKNWIVRNYGRAQVYNLPGSYQLNINIPSTMYITTFATQQVERTEISAFGGAAKFVRNNYGSFNVTYTGHQKSSHSGGSSNY